MPLISKHAGHELGREEAMIRVNRFLAKARSVSNIKGEWAGSVFAFTVTVQGIKLSGEVVVEEAAVRLNAQIPLIAMPFAGWFGRVLQLALEQTEIPEAGPAPAMAAVNTDQPTVLFLHIPKAAGTTLSEYLSSRCNDPAVADEGELFRQGIYYGAFGFFKDPDELLPDYIQPYLARPDLRAVFGHFSFGIHRHLASRSYTYITMLRNPLDRAVSMYAFLQADKQVPIESFFARPAYRELDNDQTRRIAGVEPGLGHCTREHLELAKRNLEQYFSVVGVSERFEETLTLLQQRFGWMGDPEYYPRNVTAGRPKTEDLSAEAVAHIRALNKWDEELYRFASGLMDRALSAASKYPGA